MEVLHGPGALFVSQPVTMFPPSMQRMFTTRSDVYACYSFEANTPSRTPTPERQYRSCAKQCNSMETSSHATTLQSVLRGEVPAAYSHLASSSSSQHFSSSSSLSSSSLSPVTNNNNNNHTMSMELDPLLNPVLSPCPSHHSSASYSPRPESHESNASQDSMSDMQTEPMDLSCKRSSRKRTAVSAFLNVASTNNKLSVLSTSLPAKFNTTRASSSEFLSSSSSFPTSSSPSVTTMHSFPPSPSDGQHGEEFSLLRNLLSVGKHQFGSPSSSSGCLSNSTPNLSSDRGCDSPNSDYFSRTPVTGNTRVHLAKKNLYPVSARVSDWLIKLVEFAKTIPEFSALSHNDKVTLILNSWSRLMLLYMAESNFQFAVTPMLTSDTTVTDSNPSQDEPTMKTVEGLQTFIKKCQQMSVDGKEYEFLRMLVLFNAGYIGLSCPKAIDQLNSVVQQLLQQHVRVTRPSDVMHYSRLLMCLPSLYGINSKMFETLFCKHITKNTDMEVLLKDMLQKESS
ncbi:unnamed protein product [Candidula unifasciata]|uniref:NR LBD domain-containing protein n=1 Tax=Candidula unifasciata TaxID=100452 RepID=A0A8S3ZTV4_9EUPU|nr:unnamed protein product [Candidula unifasciata]